MAEISLTGKYVWNSDPSNPGDIRAVFTPTKADEYAVAFHFNFQGHEYTYAGSAKGKLDNGHLEGQVQDEQKRRTFVFDGDAVSGTFTGKHAEMGRRDKRTETGTITLAKK